MQGSPNFASGHNESYFRAAMDRISREIESFIPLAGPTLYGGPYLTISSLSTAKLYRLNYVTKNIYNYVTKNI